jgi:murein DD-endopeptidase MepM/ murein hydrolase activator NlpD
VFAGRRGGSGIMVQLKHSNGYESYYLHLSRALVRAGQTVQQGQRIGLVGATGLATGPHLDFRMRRAGQFVNFEAMKLPRSEALAKADLGAFRTECDLWLQKLDAPAQGVIQAASAKTQPSSVGAN